MKATFLILFALLGSASAAAQALIMVEHTAQSRLNDDDGQQVGKGGVTKLKAQLTLPIKVKKDSRGGVRATTITTRATLAWQSGNVSEGIYQPEQLLNASVTVAHTRPLSARWRLAASLGVGIYSEPDDIAARSILANGAAIFICKMNDRLSLGGGAGLTNSYGTPMLLPMGYLNWTSDSKWRLTVDVANAPTVRCTRQLSRVATLDASLLEIDGMTAVMRIDGHDRIYSSTTMRSAIAMQLRASAHSTATVGVGGDWLRSVSVRERSLKGLFSHSDCKYRYLPSVRAFVKLSF